MKNAGLIPVSVTFVNWVIAIGAGSGLLPIVSLILGGNEIFVPGKFLSAETLGLLLFSIFFSAIFSVPAMLILFFTHLILNRKIATLRNHQLIHNGIHVLVALVIFILLRGEFDPAFIVAAAISYSLAGLLVWNITYRSYKRKKLNPQVNYDVEKKVNIETK